MQAVLRPGKLTRALLVVGALVAATAGTKATKAAFTDAASTEWTLTTGSLGITRDGDGLQFTSAPLAPGDAATATVRVTNSGNVPATFTLSRELLETTSPSGCAVRDALTLKVVQDGTTLVDAPLATAAADVALGELAAGAARSFEFTLTFAAQHGATATDNDNCFQGSVDRERFTWKSVES